jgi:hypothetical protein
MAHRVASMATVEFHAAMHPKFTVRRTRLTTVRPHAMTPAFTVTSAVLFRILDFSGSISEKLTNRLQEATRKARDVRLTASTLAHATLTDHIIPTHLSRQTRSGMGRLSMCKQSTSGPKGHFEEALSALGTGRTTRASSLLSEVSIRVHSNRNSRRQPSFQRKYNPIGSCDVDRPYHPSRDREPSPKPLFHNLFDCGPIFVAEIVAADEALRFREP